MQHLCCLQGHSGGHVQQGGLFEAAGGAAGGGGAKPAHFTPQPTQVQHRRCLQGAAGGMRGKVVLFKEMRDNFSEGLRFYMSLQEAIQALGQQAGDYCLTRKLQRWAGALTGVLTAALKHMRGSQVAMGHDRLEGGGCRSVTAARTHQLQRLVGAVCLRCLLFHPSNHAGLKEQEVTFAESRG